MEILTSTANPFVKHVRVLRQKKTRTEFGQFLVEGITHVGEAIEADWKIESSPVCARLVNQFFCVN